MVDRSKAKTLKGHPNAVATQLGWVDSKTGELLVSIRGLPGAVRWDKLTNTFEKKAKAAKPVQVEVEVKKEVIEAVKSDEPVLAVVDAVVEAVKSDEPVVEVTVEVKEEVAPPKAEKAKKEVKAKAKKTTKKVE